jgi:hypothetical protein
MKTILIVSFATLVLSACSTARLHTEAARAPSSQTMTDWAASLMYTQIPKEAKLCQSSVILSTAAFNRDRIARHSIDCDGLGAPLIEDVKNTPAHSTSILDDMIKMKAMGFVPVFCNVEDTRSMDRASANFHCYYRR